VSGKNGSGKTAPAGLGFRDAAPGDEALVHRFVQGLAEYEKLPEQAVAGAEDFRRALFETPQRAWVMIVEIDGQPVGMALYYFVFSTFTGRPGLYLEDIFLEQPVRGKGIGRAIFRELATRAMAQGCTRMDWSVLDWNAPAIAFYQSLGGRPKDGWSTYRLEADGLAALSSS
jgi:GNAT superfamily N-acetyltransferase